MKKDVRNGMNLNIKVDTVQIVIVGLVPRAIGEISTSMSPYFLNLYLVNFPSLSPLRPVGAKERYAKLAD